MKISMQYYLIWMEPWWIPCGCGRQDEEFLAERAGYAGEPERVPAELEGMGFTETAAYFKERFALPDSLETIKSTWVAMAEHKYCHGDSLKKGVREFLGYLKEKKIPAAICSSNSIELIRMS